jgi:hypothetical protein
MPYDKDVKVTVSIPDVDDFGARYKQYRSRAEGAGKKFFDLVMTPKSFIAAAVVTEQLGLPAVAGIAQQCGELASGALESTDKQFVGALVCALMLANGYTKTRKKRAIPEKGWTKGEVYAPPKSGSGLVLIRLEER